MTWVIGIDTGGTFTDLYARNFQTGEVRVHKRPSTPADPSRAVVEGLAELCSVAEIDPKAIGRLGHGTTVGTNSLIQRTGGKVAMVTTRGFRDLLEIGRQTRPHIFDLQRDRPAPIVPREWRLELEERIAADGAVIKEYKCDELNALIEQVGRLNVDAVAVCFLFSFLNNEHETIVGKLLAARLPGLKISLSSEVRPEFREYERFSTTAINAYLQPVMDQYLAALDKDLRRVIGSASIGINQSNGGLMAIDFARKFPVRTALSGPAAGAVGAAHVARACNRPNIISIDVGGTSADMALIRNFEVGVASERDVADLPVRLPMFDIHTIGAGGGSIAWFDKDGLLKVGPESAGARPGPACYGFGGRRPTVSDANLILGRLGSKLADGSIALNVQKSLETIQPIATELGTTVEKAARGIVEIVVANMVRAIRTISVERGHDPREFVLMAFGGAGPLHARDIAVDLKIKEILIPSAPGLLCAEGLVVAEQKEDFVASKRIALATDSKRELWRVVDGLYEKARSWLDKQTLESTQRKFEVAVDARYVGQNFELQLTVASANALSKNDFPSGAEIIESFLDAHRVAYGYANESDPIEVVNTRLTARCERAPPSSTVTNAAATTAALPQPISHRAVWFDTDSPATTPIFERNNLLPGMEITGPAVIEQFDATTPLYPGDKAKILPGNHMSIEVAL